MQTSTKRARPLIVCLLAGVLLALAAAVASVQISTQASAQDSAGSKAIVGPGESIQAAIRAADPGDTILIRGVHREDVVVRKDGISLRGVGDAALKAPARPGSPCGPVGICILGDVDLNTFELTGPRVKNVSVSGLKISGFGDGILAVGARDAAYTANEGFNNEGYGFAAFLSTGTKVVANSAHDNGFAGIYVGDSPNAGAKVTANHTFRNTLGMFYRNVRQGKIAANRIHNNCQGIVFLADAPGPSGNFAVKGNSIKNNTRACPGSEQEQPPLSGAGITLAGARGVQITGNQITGNVPSGPSAFSGGVVVARGIAGTPPRNNSVTANTILRNDPDIFWDESGTGNRFANNNCDTSVPARLCR